MTMFSPAERSRLAATRALDVVDAMLESLGPQCRTVSAANVRCVLDLDLDRAGDCDVRPWTRPTKGAHHG